MSSLFRPEALAHQQAKAFGNIVLVRPLSFTLLSWMAAAAAVAIVAFLIEGAYTQRSTVSGQLVPSSGLVKVYVPQPGIVLEKHVLEGQPVHAGDVLFVLSSERRSSTVGRTQALISEQINARQNSLRDELAMTQTAQADERDGLEKQLQGLRDESGNLDNQIADQRGRINLDADTVSKYESLAAKGYVSSEQLQQKQQGMMDQRQRLRSLERERITLSRQIGDLQTELKQLSSKQQSQRAQIERALSNSAEELGESEAKRSLVIAAPEDGTATAVIADVGQTVDRDKPMLSIVPTGSSLVAELYAPSRAIGFVKPGDAVLLRYQAYPYQKFGHQKGHVDSVSKTALSKNELSSFANLPGNANESFYRIRVTLDAQSIQAYGQPQSLQPGMLLDADVLQERRHLYEWVLDPLYTVTGKL